MKVRLLTGMAGINFSHNAGDEIDCNSAEAARYIEAGIAEAIGTVSKVERAVRKVKVEKAVKEQ